MRKAAKCRRKDGPAICLYPGDSPDHTLPSGLAKQHVSGRTLNVTTGACARPCTWKGACDWTGTIIVMEGVREYFSMEQVESIKKESPVTPEILQAKVTAGMWRNDIGYSSTCPSSDRDSVRMARLPSVQKSWEKLPKVRGCISQDKPEGKRPSHHG